MSKIEVELQDHMGSDKSICNAAWTSTYNKEKRESKYDDPEKIRKLIQCMAVEGHSTPFESVIFRFWFRWPIFVDRQHMTHRIASHNGLSGRYRKIPNDWYGIPDDVMDILRKITKSATPKYGVPLFAKTYAEKIHFQFDSFLKEQLELYNEVLGDCKAAEKRSEISNKEYKRVREVMRGVVGTASMVERTTIINLRSFANYQKLRNSEHAQKDIRQAAQMMLEEVKKANICPIALAALEEKGWQI